MKTYSHFDWLSVILAWLRIVLAALAAVLLGWAINLLALAGNLVSYQLSWWNTGFLSHTQGAYVYLALAILLVLCGAGCEYAHETRVAALETEIETHTRLQAIEAVIGAEPTMAATRLEAIASDGDQKGIAASVGANINGEKGGRGQLIAQLTQGAQAVANFRGAFIVPTLAAFSAPFLVLIVMAICVDPLTALLVLGFVLIVPLVIGAFMKTMRKSGSGFARASAKVATIFLETFEALGILRLLQAGSRRRVQLVEASEDMRKEVMQLLARNQLMIVVNDGIFALSMVTATCALALWRFLAGHLSFGAVVAVVVLTVLLHEPIDKIGRSFYVAMGGLAQEKAITKIVGVARDIACQTPAEIISPQVSVQVKSLVVARNDTEIIRKLDFMLPAGKQLAIVGPSGGGKSTLVGAITGQIAVASGEVILDGKTVNAATLRRYTAVVSQNPTIFSGTVAENIRLAKPDATEDEIWQVLETVHLATEVKQFIGEINAEVGEKGTRLSGGQMRRLGIARALLKDAPILVLDEPTADLDRRTESLVVQALEKVKAGRTVITVAHRLSTVQSADYLGVVENGRLAYWGDFASAKDDPDNFVWQAIKAEANEQMKDSESGDIRE